MLTRVILIRHGQTEYNRTRRYCGSSDPFLNAKGRSQARRLAARLRQVAVDRVYASDLRRAVQTARIIFGDRPVAKRRELREIDFGVFEGLTYGRIMARYGAVYQRWLADPFGTRVPSGESGRDLFVRATKELERIVRRERGGTVALVAHQGAIGALMCHILGYGPGHFWSVDQDSCGLTVIDFMDGMAPHIVCMNDVRHLHD